MIDLVIKPLSPPKIQQLKLFQRLSPLFDRNSELFFLSVSSTDPRFNRNFADFHEL